MTETILIMSGKGGVGKTTYSVNLAYSLAKRGHKTGILDVDIHGPNVLKLFGYDDPVMKIENNKMIPIEINPNLKVASLAGFVQKDLAIIWRGPRKHSAIKQLTEDVDWGELDYLIVDFPPGTGDEHISASQLIKKIKGAIIISTPQDLSILDMGRSINFCREMNIPIIGAIENMSGGIFGSDTVEQKCIESDVKFLGKIKLSEKIIESSKKGESFLNSDSKEIISDFENITNKIIGGGKQNMKIAITSNGNDLDSMLDERFGRCEYFIIIDTEKGLKNFEAVKNTTNQQEHGSGLKAAELLGNLDVNVLITGRIGPKATNIIQQLSLKTYHGSGRISDVFNKFQDNELEELNDSENSTKQQNVTYTNSEGTNKMSEKQNKIKGTEERIFFPLLEENGINSKISHHFGHAPFFGIYDAKTDDFKVMPNTLSHSDPTKSPIDQIEEAVNPTTIYAEGIGDRAIGIIQHKGLKLRTGKYPTPKDAIENFDKLSELTESCGHNHDDHNCEH